MGFKSDTIGSNLLPTHLLVLLFSGCLGLSKTSFSSLYPYVTPQSSGRHAFLPPRSEVTPHRSGEWKSPPIKGGASNHPQNHIHTLRCFFMGECLVNHYPFDICYGPQLVIHQLDVGNHIFPHIELIQVGVGPSHHHLNNVVQFTLKIIINIPQHSRQTQ